MHGGRESMNDVTAASQKKLVCIGLLQKRHRRIMEMQKLGGRILRLTASTDLDLS